MSVSEPSKATGYTGADLAMTHPTVTYAGPADTDPLTDDELSILLAIPRAARVTPNATRFRLPRGPTPKLGWVDVTCAQTESIVARLAVQWNILLSNVVHRRTVGEKSSVGPGTTVCILVQPPVSALFHHLAFWSLGCTVQYITQSLGESVISNCLRQSGCHIALCSEQDLRTKQLVEELDIDVVALPDSECAVNLVMEEINSPVSRTLPWPEPRRPTPAIIIHSSATTGEPKLLQFSLYYYTMDCALACQRYLELPPRKGSQFFPAKGPLTHPRLVLNPPYWQSFYFSFIVHLVTATPMAFVPTSEGRRLSGNDIIAWVEALDAGALIASAHRIREVLLLGTHAELLRSLYYIRMTGSQVDQRLSDLCTQHGIAAINSFGTSELGGLLGSSKAPYHLLRPPQNALPLLVVPFSGSEEAPNGTQLDDSLGREVQLWSSFSTSPRLAHLAARGGVPLKLEPYPGNGPCHGELAMNWGDVFREIRIAKPDAEGETELAYLHLGREDDNLRITSNGGIINASTFEAELRSLLEPQLAEQEGWHLDTVQLFGSSLPSTALVVQLYGEKQPDEAVLRGLRGAVENTNENMGLTWPKKVDSRKRMFVVVKDSEESVIHSLSFAEAGANNVLEWDKLSLAQTHKRTLQRWKNVKAFQLWLDQLDWSL
ncbi:acetyl-CoA synthetase-like protein [Ceratobasidium sp. AG-I]|nr:acetyl-CoA synthetase-like protein [Ceratobasidium sp. AG-I]